MKHMSIVLIFIFFTFIFNGLNMHALASEEAETIEALFKYLKEGNTSAILNLLTDPILTQKRAHFENNSSYSNFLTKTYEDSTLFIKNTERLTNTKSAVDVEIYFLEGGPPLKTRFILREQQGVWKISSEKILDSSH